MIRDQISCPEKLQELLGLIHSPVQRCTMSSALQAALGTDQKSLHQNSFVYNLLVNFAVR